MSTDKEKSQKYAAKLIGKLSECFDEDLEDDDFFICGDEIRTEENIKPFLHALTNILPTFFASKLIDNHNNTLEVNHLANGLCFHFSKIKE